jgi:hypothetical protein
LLYFSFSFSFSFIFIDFFLGRFWAFRNKGSSKTHKKIVKIFSASKKRTYLLASHFFFFTAPLGQRLTLPLVLGTLFGLGDYYISRVRAEPASAALRSRTRTALFFFSAPLGQRLTLPLVLVLVLVLVLQPSEFDTRACMYHSPPGADVPVNAPLVAMPIVRGPGFWRMPCFCLTTCLVLSCLV